MDSKTIILLLSIGSYVFALLLILYQWGKEKSQWIPYWITAKFLQGTGSLFLYLQSGPPEITTLLFANGALLLGCAYEAWAIFFILGRSVSRRTHFSLAAVIVAICLLTIYLSPPARAATILLVHCVLYGIPAWALLGKPRRPSVLGKVLGIGFGVLALIYFAGGMLIILRQADLIPRLGFDTVPILLMSSFCMVLISGFSLMLLAKEKSDLELKEAWEQIKTLRGILPICAHCKKIRNDKGYWEQVESYVSKHTEARFSHGICPGCVSKYFPDIELDSPE
ncbi:MAG: hypothetical protein WCO56_23670 [Verrucomicrobiota bacterium]